MNACERCGGAIMTAGPMHYAGPVCGCGSLANPALVDGLGSTDILILRVRELEAERDELRARLAAVEEWSLGFEITWEGQVQIVENDLIDLDEILANRNGKDGG